MSDRVDLQRVIADFERLAWVELERACRKPRLPIWAIVLIASSGGAALVAAGALTFKLLLIRSC